MKKSEGKKKKKTSDLVSLSLALGSSIGGMETGVLSGT